MNAARIDHLSATLDVHTEQLHLIQAGVRAHDAKLDAHDAKLDAHDAKLDALDAKFDALDAKLDALDAKVDTSTEALRAQIEANAQDVQFAIIEQRQFSTFLVDQLRAEMRQGFGAIERRFDRLEERLFGER